MRTGPAWAPVAGLSGDPEPQGDPVLAPLGMIGRDATDKVDVAPRDCESAWDRR